MVELTKCLEMVAPKWSTCKSAPQLDLIFSNKFGFFHFAKQVVTLDAALSASDAALGSTAMTMMRN